MSRIHELLKHKLIIGAFAVVGLILIGGIAYYLIETHVPALSYVTVTKANVSEDVTATGRVEPVQNPDLAFQSGGRVTYVSAAVGQKVGAGQVLASLDTGVLSANLAGAQAKLNELIAGPRAVDVAGQATAVAQANQTLATNYATLPTVVADAVAKAQGAVAVTDVYFTNPNSIPSVSSSVADHYDEQTRLNDEREAVNQAVVLSDHDLASLSSTSTPEQADAEAAVVRNRLATIESFLTDLSTVTAGATPSQYFTSTQIAAATSQINGARNTINGLILSLTSARQSLHSGQLTVQAAQNQLSLTQAGARPEDIAAQRAQVAAIAAQLRQSEIVAPFAGTVASVQVKAGDVVAPNTVGVSILPNGSYQVEAYLSEIEMTKVALGDPVSITLDAYGSSRVFDGTVASVDRAPTTVDNRSSYKVTVVLTQNDPAVTVGMSANATIHGASKQNVLAVPTTALITQGSDTFVLKKVENAPVKTPVTVGLIGTDSAEILSGLSDGDQVERIGGK